MFEFTTEIRNVTTEAGEIAGLERMLQENQGLCKYLAKLPIERREFLLKKLIGDSRPREDNPEAVIMPALMCR